MRIRLAHNLIAATLACAAAAMIGCADPPAPQAKIGHYLDAAALSGIGRVVFVELTDCSGYPQQAQNMTEAMFQAVQAHGLFHVDVVRRTDAVCRDLPLDSTSFTMRDLAMLRQALGCDAILIGNVSSFDPFPRMRITLYMRLLDLKDGRLVWGLEHVWDSTQRETELRVRNWFGSNMRTGYEPADWRLAIMSPYMFEKFVAHEASITMLPVEQRPVRQEPTCEDHVRAGARKVVKAF